MGSSAVNLKTLQRKPQQNRFDSYFDARDVFMQKTNYAGKSNFTPTILSEGWFVSPNNSASDKVLSEILRQVASSQFFPEE